MSVRRNLTLALCTVLLVTAVVFANQTSYAAFCPFRIATVQEGSCGFPRLTAEFGGGVVPRKLPKASRAPVALKLWGRVSTTDGTHPSALRELTVALDRSIAIDAKGLSVCGGGIHAVRRPPGDLRKRCRSSIVGGGRADFEIAFPERPPIRERSKLTLYNGGIKGGVTTLYAVAPIETPVPIFIATPIKIKKIHKGRYGLRTVAKLPKVAGGSGSLLDFKLKIKRLFTYNRTKHSLVSAKCLDGKLKAKIIKAILRNEAEGPRTETTIKNTTILRPCRSRG
jgi:hypothetical protein